MQIDNFEKALGEPELVDQFTSFKKQYEENGGSNIKDQFTISKKEATKAQKRLKKRMRLDTGAELTFTSKFLSNHKLLNSIGVGHEELEKIIDIAKEADALGAKLTGGGGGGNMVALAKDKKTQKKIHDAITEAGYRAYQTSFGEE